MIREAYSLLYRKNKEVIKMMDFLKFKLASSKMMKGILTKIVEKKIYEKLGYKIDIQLNDLQVDMIDGEIKAHLNVDAKMAKDEFERLMNNINED